MAALATPEEVDAILDKLEAAAKQAIWLPEFAEFAACDKEKRLRYAHIGAMDCYKNKSFEELRMEDYQACYKAADSVLSSAGCCEAKRVAMGRRGAEDAKEGDATAPAGAGSDAAKDEADAGGAPAPEGGDAAEPQRRRRKRRRHDGEGGEEKEAGKDRVRSRRKSHLQSQLPKYTLQKKPRRRHVVASSDDEAPALAEDAKGEKAQGAPAVIEKATSGPGQQSEPSQAQALGVGSLVLVGGREGTINWDGRPEHEFVTVVWEDDGTESDMIPAEDVTKAGSQPEGSEQPFQIGNRVELKGLESESGMKLNGKKKRNLGARGFQREHAPMGGRPLGSTKLVMMQDKLDAARQAGHAASIEKCQAALAAELLKKVRKEKLKSQMARS